MIHSIYIHKELIIAKWVLINSDKKEVFDSFYNARDAFLALIADHLWQNSLNNKDNPSTVYNRSCVPDRIGYFLESRYEERTITDEDIVLQSRLDMLFEYFLSKNADEIRDNALKVINHSIKYHSRNEDFNEEMKINIELDESELKVDIIADNGKESFLSTNAFIMDDDSKRYYFKSRQCIITTDVLDDLEKIIESCISVEPYNDDNRYS